MRIFRESDEACVGPFPVLRVDGKRIFMLNGKRKVQYSVHQAIPAKKFEDILSGDCQLEILYESTKQFRPTKRKRKNETQKS